jgi:phospholipid transport system substrate-binding protein
MSTPRSIRSPLAVLGLAVPLLAGLAVAVPAQSSPAPAAPPTTARAFVTSAIADVTAILKDRPSTSRSRRARIEPLVERWFDAETVAKLVLAKNWKQFDEAQQAEFVSHFRRHLVLTYYRNVDRYAFDRIEVYEDRAETKGDWTVRTKVIAPDAGDVLIDLRVRGAPDGGDWKVIDILIEGVSLVQNFRAQFQELLSNGKPAKLLDSLRQKNEETLRNYEAVEAREEAEAGAQPPPGSVDPPKGG